VKLYRKYGAGNCILSLLSILIAVIFLFPLLFGLFASLKAESASFRKLIDWFKPPYTLAAYPLAKMEFLGKRSLFFYS
jgi:multiple sugar transport system permease protein